VPNAEAVPPPATATETPDHFGTVIAPTVSANPNAPILIYTYTQKLFDNGSHVVATCVMNIGTSPAHNIDVLFVAGDPAQFSGVRIPPEQITVGNTQAIVRIDALSPRTVKQFEVAVTEVEQPLPEWVTVTITGAYALNHSGDGPFPTKCDPEGIQSTASNSRFVAISVGSQYDVTIQRLIATAVARNRGQEPFATGPSGPTIAMSALYCFIASGILSLLMLIVLALVRRGRKREYANATHHS
jgi:hypothetical protein